MGKRGKHHAAAVPRQRRLRAGRALRHRPGPARRRPRPRSATPGPGPMPPRWRRELKPDVFCFCTLPHIRSEMIRIGVECGARLIAFEKPVALTSREGLEIKELLAGSRRQGRGQPPAPLRQALPGGEGRSIAERHDRQGAHRLRHRPRLDDAHAVAPDRLLDAGTTATPRPSGSWPRPRASGKLADAHASPDYIGGFVQFANGVRGIVECGAGAPDVPEVECWWRKNRIGATGHRGLRRGLHRRRLEGRDPERHPRPATAAWTTTRTCPRYIQDMADWLDDGRGPPLLLRERLHRLRDHDGHAQERGARRPGRAAASGRRRRARGAARALPGAPLQVTLEESRKEYGG